MQKFLFNLRTNGTASTLSEPGTFTVAEVRNRTTGMRDFGSVQFLSKVNELFHVTDFSFSIDPQRLPAPHHEMATQPGQPYRESEEIPQGD